MKARFEKISIDDYSNINTGYTAILKLWEIDSQVVKQLLLMDSKTLGKLLEELTIIYKLEEM